MPARPTPRPRRASALVLLLTLLAAACGDGTSAPSPRATLRVTGPASAPGTLSTVPGGVDWMRHECAYEVELTAGGTPLQMRGVLLTLQPRAGGDLPIAEQQRFSAAEVAEWLGGPEIAAHHTRVVELRTWYTFAPTANEYGRSGAHRARWAFAYDGGDTTAYEVECLPAMSTFPVAFYDRRDSRAIDRLTVELNGQPLVTRAGYAWYPQMLVAGRYPVNVRDPRYVPVDTLIDTRPASTPIVRLTRLAPRADAATGATMMDPPTGGWIDVHHPDGVARLPARLHLVMRESRATPARTFTAEGVGADLDATRRRYTFTEDVRAVTDIEFVLPWAGHPDAALACRRPGLVGGWECGDA